MGGRARPSPIRPQRLAQGHLEVALWSSGALGRILARVLNSESRERANTGTGVSLWSIFRGLGRGCSARAEFGSPLDLKSSE